MKSDRLFQIVHILLSRGKVKATELAEIFEVSTRTIYRDIDALSGAGIPVYATKGKNGGISLLDNYIINKSLLSNEEQNHILAGLETLKAVGYEDVENELMKLKNLFNREVVDWIEIDFSHWGSSSKQKEMFQTLKYALINYYKIDIVYVDFKGEITKREISPIKIIFKHSNWYLQAFCNFKEDYRIFKINRIKKIEVTFVRNNYNDYDKVLTFQKEKNNINLKLKISKDVEYRVYDEFNESEYVINDDGSFLVNIEAPEDEWLYQYILSFGEHVEIIEPRCINVKIKKVLEKLLNNYNMTQDVQL